MSNTQRDNVNKIFTCKQLDKLDDLVDALKGLTINDAEYYESDTSTTSNARGVSALNPKTVIHTSNRKEKLRTLETVILIFF